MRGRAAALAREVLARAVRFWAEPIDGTAVAAFRVAFGLLAAQVTVWTAVNLDRWFSEEGVAPSRVGFLAWSLYRFAPAAEWMGPLHVALLAVGTVAFTIGLFPRAGAFLVFAAHTSLQHRTPQILNSGDRLFAIVAFLAMFLPLAHRFSVTSWWRARRGRPPLPPVSRWGARLIQLQIAYLYANTALSKAMGARWIEGRALRDVLASPVFAEWPAWIDFWPVVYAMTWGTLLFEGAFPALVWFRRTRWIVLGAGVVFHLLIDVLMIIPMFSWIMIVSYLTFVEDEDVRRAVGRLVRAPRLLAVESSLPRH